MQAELNVSTRRELISYLQTNKSRAKVQAEFPLTPNKNFLD